MKYGPGEQAVPELHSSGFNLLSALGCGRVGIPFVDIRGGGRSGAELHKGQEYLFGGVCLCIDKDLLTLVTLKKLLKVLILLYGDALLKWTKGYT